MMLILKEFCLFGLLENNFKQHKKTSSELWGWLFLFIQFNNFLTFISPAAAGIRYMKIWHRIRIVQTHTHLSSVFIVNCSFSPPCHRQLTNYSFPVVFTFDPIWGFSSGLLLGVGEEKRSKRVRWLVLLKEKILRISKYSHLWNILKISIEKRDWYSSCVFLGTSPVVKIQQQPNEKPTIHIMVALGTTNQVMWVQLVLCSRDHQQSGVEVTG